MVFSGGTCVVALGVLAVPGCRRGDLSAVADSSEVGVVVLQSVLGRVRSRLRMSVGRRR